MAGNVSQQKQLVVDEDLSFIFLNESRSVKLGDGRQYLAQNTASNEVKIHLSLTLYRNVQGPMPWAMNLVCVGLSTILSRWEGWTVNARTSGVICVMFEGWFNFSDLLIL